MSISSSSV